jgi:hypothetical protein
MSKKSDGKRLLFTHLQHTELAMRFVDILCGAPAADEDRDLARILEDAGLRLSQKQYETMKFHYSEFTGWILDVEMDGYSFTIHPRTRKRLWANVVWFGGTNSGPVLGHIFMPISCDDRHIFRSRLKKFFSMIVRHAKKTRGK